MRAERCAAIVRTVMLRLAQIDYEHAAGMPTQGAARREQTYVQQPGPTRHDPWDRHA